MISLVVTILRSIQSVSDLIACGYYEDVASFDHLYFCIDVNSKLQLNQQLQNIPDTYVSLDRYKAANSNEDTWLFPLSVCSGPGMDRADSDLIPLSLAIGKSPGNKSIVRIVCSSTQGHFELSHSLGWKSHQAENGTGVGLGLNHLILTRGETLFCSPDFSSPFPSP